MSNQAIQAIKADIASKSDYDYKQEQYVDAHRQALESLSNLYRAWLIKEGIQYHYSADDLLYNGLKMDLDHSQLAWLRRFIETWQALENV